MKTFNEYKNTNNHCTVQNTLYMYSAQVFDEKKIQTIIALFIVHSYSV